MFDEGTSTNSERTVSAEETPLHASPRLETPETATRKLRIHQRAGHRGTATRLMRELEEAVYNSDARKLKYIKNTLEKKSEILATLDEQIAEETEGTKLETEIQQADVVKENIELALMTITDKLESLQTPQSTPDIYSTRSQS